MKNQRLWDAGFKGKSKGNIAKKWVKYRITKITKIRKKLLLSLNAKVPII